MKKKTVLGISTLVLWGWLWGAAAAGNNPLDDARTLYRDRHYDKAIAGVKNEIRTSGASADLLVVMADSYLALGKERKAEKFYRQALELEPAHIDGSLNLAMLLVAQRERKEAIALIKRILAENPGHARAHFCLGMTYNARADINDAFAQYKILKKLDEDLARELYNAIFAK
jgi:cytochrome c-type biogenesis protein CcmH/NrfG